MTKILTCCFSGYRSEKFEFPLEASWPEYVRLLEDTRLAMVDAVEEGYENFLVGMASGFDLGGGMAWCSALLGEFCPKKNCGHDSDFFKGLRLPAIDTNEEPPHPGFHRDDGAWLLIITVLRGQYQGRNLFKLKDRN